MTDRNYPLRAMIAAIRLNLAAKMMVEGLRKPKKAMTELAAAVANFESAWKAKK